MTIEIFYKDNGKSDIEIDSEMVAINVANPEIFVRSIIAERIAR